MSIVQVAARRHFDVSDQYCHLRPCWYQWSILLQRAMLASVVLMQPRVVLMSMAGVSIKGQADICGLCCCPKPHLHSQVRLLPGNTLVSVVRIAPEALLMSLASTAAEGFDGVCSAAAECHIDEYGLYRHQRPS